MSAEIKGLRTHELMARLRRHYIAPSGMPGGVFVPECGKNGAWGASSRCDALYAGFTSTSGRILIGHEVKVSRADWLHELKQLEKADEWADQCHAWYLVVAEPGIVHDGELPNGWGLMAPTSKTRTRLTILTPARIHADRNPSWDAVRSMMARLDTLQAAAVAEHWKVAQADINAQVEQRLAARPLPVTSPEDQHRLRRVDELEASLGITVSDWDATDRLFIQPSRLAQAVKLLEALEQAGHSYQGLGRLADQLAKHSTHLRDAQHLVATLLPEAVTA